MIEEIKSIEKIEDSNNLKEIINILIKEVNKLDVELKDLKKISEDKIEEKEVNCLDKLDKKEEITEVQNEKIEEVKIEKMNINKFVEAFPEYIKIEAFSEEMENEEMIGKLIEIFKSIFGAKDKKIEEKEKELENKNEEYIKVKKERDSMGDLLEARQLYNSYLEMEETIKSKFKNILFQKDFESFISSGYSISTIDNIWDIVKIEYKNISSENLDKLRKIFKFFITQINKRFENPTYGLIEARLEEDFDPVTQFDLSQNSSGKIIEFIFYGYGTLEDKSSSDDKDIIDKIRKRPLVLTK